MAGPLRNHYSTGDIVPWLEKTQSYIWDTLSLRVGSLELWWASLSY